MGICQQLRHAAAALVRPENSHWLRRSEDRRQLRAKHRGDRSPNWHCVTACLGYFHNGREVDAVECLEPSCGRLGTARARFNNIADGPNARRFQPPFVANELCDGPRDGKHVDVPVLQADRPHGRAGLRQQRPSRLIGLYKANTEISADSINCVDHGVLVRLRDSTRTSWRLQQEMPTSKLQTLRSALL